MLTGITREGGESRPPLLLMTGIAKRFAGVHALKGVDLSLRGGEVHALLGENGAGKSTLVKIMFGIIQPDEGRIALDPLGTVRIDGPRDALAMGIGLVSQELSLVPQLDVAQNIFLGRTRGLRLVPRGDFRRQARKILDDLAPHLKTDTPVSALGMADRQLVEISRTLARGGRIVAFDEPTSSLTPAEQESLFAVIRRLKAAGKAIVYISHRMNEIRVIADRVTILRDGEVVASGLIGGYSEARLNELVAGRELSREMGADKPAPVRTAAVLELRKLSTARVHEIDLEVGAGEIVGLSGLVGSGRSAILRGCFGIDALTGGEINVGGKAVRLEKPADAMTCGVALIPEDRRGHAIVPMMDVERNFGLGNHDRFASFGVIKGSERRRSARRYVDELRIRPPSIATEMRNLSGGNQQKVVIARWLATGARIFLFDEPTRGIDVGAKAEIYALLRRLAADGAALLVVSSELPELLLICHRIGIVSGGRLRTMVENDANLTEAKLIALAAGEDKL
ncbi:sugar ABC transporter ATP-binding protein [Mesorhizobium sp. DCY119]|uniref:sugar ABC transporter ATP-binding protein n=1 Tax=Mesorhizobium sp. DCY119 TaxID=2108445 RepID=UPI000E6D4009|nr:sugar ABC transporter ATP-binding protein [Mesorhizobium sp. DCY119]RJG46146.1 sugar ABC transporter ATP-binding protein [Mesorhizobium sp. DCY119]